MEDLEVEYEKSDRTFTLPDRRTIPDKVFDRAMMEVTTRPKGRPSWFGTLKIDQREYIYELFAAGKTTGEVSTHLRQLDWVRKQKLQHTAAAMRRRIGKFAGRLEKYFTLYYEMKEKEETENMAVAIPEQYEKPILPEHYDEGQADHMRGLMANAAKAEARVNKLLNVEMSDPLAGNDPEKTNALTKAIDSYHKIAKDIVCLVRGLQLMPEGDTRQGLTQNNNFSMIFNDVKKSDSMMKAADNYLTLIQKNMVPLVKDANGKYTEVKKNGSGRSRVVRTDN